MGRAYKNFWSLNTDEAVVAGILRAETSKDVEVFLPLNAQMKDVDLICVNMKTKKMLTIQVKGSRAYEPKEKKIGDFCEGSGGWFLISKRKVEESTADFFIFLVYVLEQDKENGRILIRPHTISIPTRELKRLVRDYKVTHGKDAYSFKFWVNPKKKLAFDFRDKKYYVSEYLDKRGFERLNNYLV